MALLAPDAYRPPRDLMGASWEPPRSTSGWRSEVLRGGSHEAPVTFRWGQRERVRCGVGGTGGRRLTNQLRPPGHFILEQRLSQPHALERMKPITALIIALSLPTAAIQSRADETNPPALTIGTAQAAAHIGKQVTV